MAKRGSVGDFLTKYSMVKPSSSEAISMDQSGVSSHLNWRFDRPLCNDDGVAVISQHLQLVARIALSPLAHQATYNQNSE